MQYSYLIIDDDQANAQETLSKFEAFPEYFCIGVANNRTDAVNKILEFQPQLVFLEIAPKSKKSDLSSRKMLCLTFFMAVSQVLSR